MSRQYRWALNPTAKDLLYYRSKHPEVLNTAESSYDIVMATDELLSIYIEMYTYGIGAAHSVQQSFTVNFDLKSRRLVKLRDIFDPNADYLHFVSRYCTDELRKRFGEALFDEELAPDEKNFQSWNATKEGLKLNFDACKVTGCSGGK